VSAITAAMSVGLPATFVRALVGFLARVNATVVVEGLIPLEALAAPIERAEILPVCRILVLR